MNNKTEKMSIWPLILFVVLMIAISIVVNYELRLLPTPMFNLTCPESSYNLSCPEIPEPICNTDCPSCPEQPLFMREAANVADAHYYEDARYMCCDFSIKLFNRLEADGYDDVKICEGKALWCDPDNDKRNCEHCWVKIGESIVIESITGEVIPPKDYHEKYDERWCYDYIPNHIESWTKYYG